METHTHAGIKKLQYCLKVNNKVYVLIEKSLENSNVLTNYLT